MGFSVFTIIGSKFSSGTCSIAISDEKDDEFTVRDDRRLHACRSQDQRILLGLLARGTASYRYHSPLFGQIHLIQPLLARV